jgi:hypothetical protein
VQFVAAVSSASALRSAPAQKVPPAPNSTAARHAGSASKQWNAALNRIGDKDGRPHFDARARSSMIVATPLSRVSFDAHILIEILRAYHRCLLRRSAFARSFIRSGACAALMQSN